MSSHVCKERIGFYETSFKLVIEALIGVNALPLKCKTHFPGTREGMVFLGLTLKTD